MLPIDYLPTARNDFDESFNWYAKRSVLAAERFANAVDIAIQKLSTNPTQFLKVDAIHHAYPVKKFPFRIVYRVLKECILIVAIAHAKRRPNYWK